MKMEALVTDISNSLNDYPYIGIHLHTDKGCHSTIFSKGEEPSQIIKNIRERLYGEIIHNYTITNDLGHTVIDKDQRIEV